MNPARMLIRPLLAQLISPILLISVIIETVAAQTAAPDFTIVGLPDTQKYAAGSGGGEPEMFVAQTQWIVDNMEELNIAFVSHLGDCVNNGNEDATEWDNAEDAMSLLEDPLTTLLPDGLPYGICVGNHDQTPDGDPDGNSTELYNQYFGVSRFSGRNYYGGNFGSNNDNHYQLFSVSGMDFINISLEFDDSQDQDVLDWADDLLKTYSDRRAILSSHGLIQPGDQGSFRRQGRAIYEALKDNPNLFLMLCGHKQDEGRRVDTFQGNTVYTLLSDYSTRGNGGNAFLRIMTFSPANDEIRVTTYSPTLDQYETDEDSEFTLFYDMEGDLPLPVELLAFTAAPGDRENTLNWSTSSEINNLGFVLERSVNTDTAFIQIASYDSHSGLSGQGNSNQRVEYSFVDSGLENDMTYYYRLSDVDLSGKRTYLKVASASPHQLVSRYDLYPNYPNPFNPETTIRFEVPASIPWQQRVELTIYNGLGQPVRKLYRGLVSGGMHEIRWNSRNEQGNRVPSGVYFLEMRANNFIKTSRMLLLR